MNRLLSLFFLLGVSISGFTQTNEGTDFWMGFMEHHDRGINTMVVMVTATAATNGVVSMPLTGWSRSFSVAANQVSLITVPREAENMGSESPSNKAIHLTAEDPVSVYIHQYHSFRAEATVVLPTEVIDQEYYVMSYPGIFSDGEQFPSQFLLVGTQDDTEVKITLSDNTLNGKTAGSNFTVKLKAGQTYQVQTARAGEDLTGTFIRSDKKLAVFAGCRWVEIPTGCTFRDNLLEQMYPVNTWGKLFVTIPSAKVTYDIYRIMAAEDDTHIELDGANPRVFELDAGQFVEYQSNTPAFITADKPIVAAQYLIGSSCNGLGIGDPAFVLLNSVEQTRTTVTLHNSSFQNILENYINIIAQTADVNNIRIDGKTIAEAGSSFNPIGANPLFSYAQIRVQAGSHTITSSGCGVIATAYGYGEIESYAYSGGASYLSINDNAIPEGGCAGLPIQFDTGLSPDRYSAQWDLGDGTTSTQHRFEYTYDQVGRYPVKLTTYDRCLDEENTSLRDLQVTQQQAVTATPAVEVCEGIPFRLEASHLANATYAWTGPDGYFSVAQNPAFDTPAPGQTGLYSVVGIISGCATTPAFTEVNIHARPQPYLGEDEQICTRRAGFDLLLDPGQFLTYRWQDNSRLSTFRVEEAGLYRVEVSDEFGCTGSDELLLSEQCPTRFYAPTAFSPNDDGVNDRFHIFAFDVEAWEIRIYDRWGGLVFESSDPAASWNGEQSDRPAAAGVYVWMISFDGFREDGTPYSGTESGTVTLVR